VLNYQLYDLRRAAHFSNTARLLARTAVIAFAVYLLIYFLVPRNLLPRLYVIYFFALAGGLQLIWRWLYSAALTRQPFRRRALLLGDSWASQTMLAALLEFCPAQYEVAGSVDTALSPPGPSGLETRPSGTHYLRDIVRLQKISEIILCVPERMEGTLLRELLDCQAEGVAVTLMHELYEQITGRIPIAHTETDWMVFSFIDRVRVEWWFRLAKRLLDVAGAAVGLIGLAILLPVVAVAIWLESGRPVFYRQTRLGQGGRPFEMYKFRTMVLQAEADGQARWAEPDDNRVTRVGRILRRTRLDETPQFWNVLAGHMSLVGPRPERPEFIASLETQIPFYRARLLVKPGITGWAQINYPYSRSVDEAAAKLQYDLYYVKHQSLWLDLVILTKTPRVLVTFEGT
jgi:exopolysaccharide biosynthesis polyprenyl glycosylphosphotransferase